MSAATDAPAAEAHGARMDAIYGLQRHVYDLTRKYYLLGRDRLIAGLALAPAGALIEIGCGTARNLALAARHYPRARLYGIDISAEMLKSARRNLKGIDAALALGDAAEFDPEALFGRARFDRVMFSYTLSMIPEWQAALEQGCRILAPGGSVHVADFGQQQHLPRWFGPAFRAYLARFHVTPRAALFDIGAELAGRHGLLLETAAPYRDYARTMVLRRP
ncbi:MAG: class I SAM-dependent methyltransferase [Candidatus Andeanibacterium colombiense]|uniref:Class I SAM-dependent methyltransferase n=1 Tax=Candidatus Andeanibacterium colombiense TaxID=3121345 RepID=A0AAJ5X238_9SPHN|nr:MAG: class I SAM-dependent methyltransferase [Sphingomonadaceae bacterium]